MGFKKGKDRQLHKDVVWKGTLLKTKQNNEFIYALKDGEKRLL